MITYEDFIKSKDGKTTLAVTKEGTGPIFIALIELHMGMAICLTKDQVRELRAMLDKAIE